MSHIKAKTYTEAECKRCADDVISAGSVASTACSSGGTITRTTAGLLGHNSVGVLCAQRVNKAAPLRCGSNSYYPSH